MEERCAESEAANVMMSSERNAPGGPGISPRWTSSAKSGVGTALARNSRVWFTLSHGIFNEIYYGRIDQACIRDMGMIVTDGEEFFSEEKRDTDRTVEWLADGVPGFRLINSCRRGRYRIEKEILTDPKRNTVLQQTRFIPREGELAEYHLYILLAPHLGNQGFGNTAWVGEVDNAPVLFAQREGNALALACSAPWLKRSVGYVGSSDGWQDLQTHKQMRWIYTRAEKGNVAITAEVDLAKSEGSFVLALGFGSNPDQAAQSALDSLRDGFDKVRDDFIGEWQIWQETLTSLNKTKVSHRDLSRISAAVLRTHESKPVPGGIIASLSIPWGFARGDNELGGYHLVWPRDLVEAAGGLLALGAVEDALRVLRYLQDKQDEDGHWEQNMWVDGTRYWGGVQLDETAFPILLVDLIAREGVLNKGDANRFWPMVRRAARFLAVNGPVTSQDRWEEDPGYSPFTLAVSIAALLVAADMAEQNGESSTAQHLRDIADFWNDSIERWTYAGEAELCLQECVRGYYVRITPPEVADAASPTEGFVPIKNRPPGQSNEPAAQIISPDALALVRFGLRAPDDPRILNTIRVVDDFLKVETPGGPAWHRYKDDGYGEHEDGSPFDGTGIGRAWPLMTGERAHYELAAGHTQEAYRLLRAMEAFANEEGLIPEQIWDTQDIPDRGLFNGKPSGSAMPLVWAHAEYVKLRRSLQEGWVFDMPRHTVARYIKKKTTSPYFIWRFSHKGRSLPAGKKLRFELMSAATVHWSSDDWETTQDIRTRQTGLGIHVADLSTERLHAGQSIAFTFHWTERDHWEGANFLMQVT